MTISQILKFALKKLSTSHIDSPRLEAEILLSHVLRKPRECILGCGEKKITSSQISNFKFLVSKRLQGKPIAYLTRQKEFYGLNFFVNQNVLIPRPETELMVEEALKLATCNMQSATFVDIGTGSGCIIITLAKLLSQKSRIMNYELWGIDISKKVLAIARQNAKVYHVDKKIKFLHGNLLEPLIKSKIQNPKSKIFLANLPYLTPTQIKNSPTIKDEPKSALNGGPDGLKYYRRLLKQINQLTHLHKFALNSRIFVFLEIDPGQTVKIKQLIKCELPQASLQIKKDLAGLNRLAIITLVY